MTAFFIPDLVESLTGQSGRGPFSPFHRAEVSGEAGLALPEHFQASGEPPHLCLDLPLTDAWADGIHQGLRAARFTPHHHTDYRIEISALRTLAAGPLKDFTGWLQTPAAAEFHRAWAGWPGRGSTLQQVQVQVARARRGHEFPVHIDTDDDGLSAVYAFTRGFAAGSGGVLYFPKLEGEGNRLWVEPAFNRVLLFRPRGAPHGVSRIEQRGATRYTISAFYLYRRQRAVRAGRRRGP